MKFLLNTLHFSHCGQYLTKQRKKKQPTTLNYTWSFPLSFENDRDANSLGPTRAMDPLPRLSVNKP